MSGYIVRRLLWAPVVLLVVSFFTFVLGFYGPGDPIEVRLGQRYDPEIAERVRHELGLDRPFGQQYLEYISRALRGDLGESIKFRNRPVTDVIFDRIWVSVQLGAVALALSLGIGIPMGLIAAMHQGRWLDTAIVVTTLLPAAISTFVTWPVLLIVFVRTLKLLPAGGWGGIFDVHIILPALTLALAGSAGVTRMMRASSLEVVGQDYVRTARAKGLPERLVVGRHILRNALIPMTTVVTLSIGSLVEGSFIAETLWGVPGIGALALESISARDYPVFMAISLIVALAFIFANLAADIMYSVVDPRIRLR
jgi:ABC-type dipeptide/oligopeptide/nickel transport system permease component